MTTPTCTTPRGAAARAWFGSVAQDVRPALGSFRFRPVFALTVFTMAALGIAAYWPTRRAPRVNPVDALSAG